MSYWLALVIYKTAHFFPREFENVSDPFFLIDSFQGLSSYLLKCISLNWLHAVFLIEMSVNNRGTEKKVDGGGARRRTKTLLVFYKVLKVNNCLCLNVIYIVYFIVNWYDLLFKFSNRCWLYSDPHFPLRGLLLQRHHLLGSLLPLLLVFQWATVGSLQQHLE